MRRTGKVCDEPATAMIGCGAAYLVYVGWSMLGVRRKKPGSLESGDGSRAAIKCIADDAILTGGKGQNDLIKVFMKGFWTNVLNPKVALFLLVLGMMKSLQKSSFSGQDCQIGPVSAQSQ